MKKLRSNAHTHTSYCDGKNSAEEMVRGAIEKGFVSLGFSGHSELPNENDWAMSAEGTKQYRRDVLRLKEQYADKIELFLGIEQDSESIVGTEEYDYVIGSVHYLRDGDTFYTFDNTHDEIRQTIDESFGGDSMAMVRRYYELAAELPHRMKPDVVGHFDLITKLNAGNRYFDAASKQYQNLALEAIDHAANAGCIFEVNTGGVYRGYTEIPYPAPFLMRHLRQRGARLTITSDAHNVDSLEFLFETAIETVKQCGFTSLWILKDGTFQEISVDAF